MSWFDVEVKVDEDPIRRYAVEAVDSDDAARIAVANLPKPETNVLELDGKPDDNWDFYDAVIEA